MRVLVNNYNNYNNEEVCLREITCENCGSKLEYDKQDITVGVYGAPHIRCCLCEHNNMLDTNDGGITLTKDNIEYPTHFWHTSIENGAIDTCDNENVRKAINDAIEFFRNNKKEYSWYTMSGNLCVFVQRFDGDEEYVVWVTNDYHSTYIPFEQEDYADYDDYDY
jgi:hypothetical protein